MRKRITLQLWMASILTIAGIVLIWTAFLIVPRGEIHNSVLLAFGEMSTFAGALFGIDYKHRLDRYIHQPKPPKQEQEREQEEDEDN